MIKVLFDNRKYIIDIIDVSPVTLKVTRLPVVGMIPAAPSKGAQLDKPAMAEKKIFNVFRKKG